MNILKRLFCKHDYKYVRNIDWKRSLWMCPKCGSFQYRNEIKCDGCNNVKGCITCEDGSEWAHYEDSGDLEKDLDTYIQDNFTIDKEQLDRFGIEPKDYLYSMTKDDMLKMVRNFTYWQKQQMMKDAVEGLVICDELTHGYKDIVFAIPDVLKVGDKVKLIIIKEE